MAEKCGELYEVSVPVGCMADSDIDSSRDPWRIYKVSESTWTGQDLMGGKLPGGTLIVATERAKLWLEKHYGEWLQFIPAVTTQ